MKTLDRYIIRNFLASAGLFLVAMIAMRIVGDLFFNIDEFAEVEIEGFFQRLSHVGRYYGYQSLVYFIEMGGVIIVASAAFALAKMNHTNELTAMLAAGVSLHRVTVPIVICAMILGGLIIVDQEIVISRIAPELVLDRDEKPGEKVFPVRLITDGNGSVWYAKQYRSGDRAMEGPAVIRRDDEYRGVAFLAGSEARPGRVNGQNGWAISKGRLMGMGRLSSKWLRTPNYERIWSNIGPRELLEACKQTAGSNVPLEEIRSAGDIKVHDEAYDLTIRAEHFEPRPPPRGKKGEWSGSLTEPTFEFAGPDGSVLGIFRCERAEWETGEFAKGCWKLAAAELFCPSDLTAENLVLRESGNWMDYMSTSDLTRLTAMQKLADRRTAELIKHARFIAPVNNLVMLLLGLPFILSRERNIKASATLCLLIVLVFFAFIFICRYIGLSPLLAGWLPLLVFGPIAVLMLHSVKT